MVMTARLMIVGEEGQMALNMFAERCVWRAGTCTSWLERQLAPFLDGSSEEARRELRIPVFLRPARSFLLPSNLRCPLVMIGPGTGVAPFRGFLLHRLAQTMARVRNAKASCTGVWRGEFEVESPDTSEVLAESGAMGEMELFVGFRWQVRTFGAGRLALVGGDLIGVCRVVLLSEEGRNVRE